MTAKPLRILHLSDLHFSQKTNWDSESLLHGFTETVAQLAHDGPFHAVAVTGDIAFSGKPEEYEIALQWFRNQLGPALAQGDTPFPRDRFLIVPGNHDFDRSQVSRTFELLRGDFLEQEKPQAIAGILTDAEEAAPLFKPSRA